MKVSVDARKLGISYRTAYRWFKAGQVPGYPTATGTIIITDPVVETVPADPPQKIASTHAFVRLKTRTIWKVKQND